MKEMIEKINFLKKEQNAIILAHTYTHPEVQDIADFVGDSYGLSKKAADAGDFDTIVFAGVRFMAETAKILSPQRKVLLPVLAAGCPMADMIDEHQLAKFKSENPGAKVVCYVNSDVRTKALSDVCVTSSNAVKIVKKLDAEKILFVPDMHLGSYVAEQVPEKEIICWKGFCPVHHAVKPEDVIEAKKLWPNAVVLMHPECPPQTRITADFILSTGQMETLVKEKKYKQYIIVTESGITYPLSKADKGAEFIELPSASLMCVNMKKIMLTDVLRSLEENVYEIEIPKAIEEKARAALLKMLELAK
ncbi:MAG TPA: quinolinate synthase NadA [bacterium]|nr:quinolinate synthase NadA [bacterium]